MCIRDSLRAVLHGNQALKVINLYDCAGCSYILTASFALIRFEAVSYTHLDVYKRQT